MKRLLTILPSRSRPERIKETLSSFKDTITEDTDLLIMVDDDDPDLNNYNLDGYRFEIGKRKMIDEYYHEAIKNNPYQYYFLLNDDMVFRTRGWDKILPETIEEKGNSWGVAFGDDMIHSGKIMRPTVAVVSRNIWEELGFIMPSGIGLCGDWYLGELCGGAGCLFYRPDVIIEHKHALVQKASLDETYRSVCGGINKITEQVRQDILYRKYQEEQLPKDIQRLADAIRNSN